MNSSEITLTMDAIDAGLPTFDDLSDASKAVWRDALMKSMWRNRLRPNQPMTIKYIAKETSVEFALLCLGMPGAQGQADLVGRVVAVMMALWVFDRLDPGEYTGGDIRKHQVIEMATGLVKHQAPAWDWRHLMKKGRAGVANGALGHWRDRANLAVYWCVANIFVPDDEMRKSRTINASKLAAIGRRCAYYALRSAVYAGVTANSAFRGTHEMRDMAWPEATHELREEMDIELDRLETSLMPKIWREADAEALEAYLLFCDDEEALRALGARK